MVPRAAVGTALLDPAGRLVACDPVFDSWLGGRPLRDLLPELTVPAELPAEETVIVDHPLTGERVSAQASWRSLEGNGQTYLLLCIDLASEPRATVQRDPVTGLPDRRTLQTFLDRLAGSADGDPVPYAVLFMDLDDFKQINDRFGHRTGDHVLAVLASRWKKALRQDDLLVRYGGDEFVVMLRGIRNASDAAPITDRLKQVTALPIDHDGQRSIVHVTIGIATATSKGAPLDDVISAADRAMYAAKRQGPPVASDG